jgi:CIC family chloride channel protein
VLGSEYLNVTRGFLKSLRATAVFRGKVPATAGNPRGDAAQSSVALRDIASRAFTIVREDDIVFDVIRRMRAKQAMVALVVRGTGVPRPESIAGVIGKEHIADSVASSVSMYPGGD